MQLAADEKAEESKQRAAEVAREAAAVKRAENKEYAVKASALQEQIDAATVSCTALAPVFPTQDSNLAHCALAFPPFRLLILFAGGLDVEERREKREERRERSDAASMLTVFAFANLGGPLRQRLPNSRRHLRPGRRVPSLALFTSDCCQKFMDRHQHKKWPDSPRIVANNAGVGDRREQA